MSDHQVIEQLMRLGMDRKMAEYELLQGAPEEQLELRLTAALSTVLYTKAGVGLKTLLWLARVIRTMLEGRP